MNVFGLEKYGIKPVAQVYRNPSEDFLKDVICEREGGVKTRNGAVSVKTGKYTDTITARYIVDEPYTTDKIHWTRDVRKISAAAFDELTLKAAAVISEGDVFVRDGEAGVVKGYRTRIRVVSERAYQCYFASGILTSPEPKALDDFHEDFTVICAPSLVLAGKDYGIDGDSATIINFHKRVLLILGTGYCGEIKSGIFTYLNYRLPLSGVLGLRCAANAEDENGNGAVLFFGREGAGKTTFSVAADRYVLGNDELGWSEEGVFNLEGGFYARAAKLNKETESEVYSAIRAGALLENVPVKHGSPEYSDLSLSANPRVLFPLSSLPRTVLTTAEAKPAKIVFLCKDVFGVLPTVARLTPEQAAYYFVSGYTGKTITDDKGATEIKSTFSTCFCGSCLPLKTSVYTDLFGEKLTRSGAEVFLVNTGWRGGDAISGERIPVGEIKAIISALIGGELDGAEYETEALFGFNIPKTCPGVAPRSLNPVNNWKDRKEYENHARMLAGDFVSNARRLDLSPEAVKAGPKV